MRVGGFLKNREGWLWGLALFVIFLWFLARSYFHLDLPAVEFLSRSWLSAKLSIQRNFFQSHFKPSKRIALLQLEYSNRADFWFDDVARKKLASALQDYEGPILTNLDPIRLLKDESLKTLFDKPNFIRPFRVEYREKLDQDLERIVAGPLEQDPSVELSAEENLKACAEGKNTSRCYADAFGVLPSNQDYFSEKSFWGSIVFRRVTKAGDASISTLTNSISSLPLRVQAGRRDVPLGILGALAMENHCHQYRFDRKNQLSFQNCAETLPANIQLQEPLPLVFYPKNYERLRFWTTDMERLPKDKILVVEVIDSANFTNILGEKMTWGEVMATAMSNILQNHSPVASKSVSEFTWFVFSLSLLLLVLFHLRLNLRRYFEAFLALMISLVLLDILATTYFNFQTEPSNEFLALGLIGLWQLAIRSRKASLVERALSGYVSPERLKDLMSGKEKLELSGQRKELTTLLLDMAGFTVITKEMPVTDVFPLVKEFFSIIDPIIFEHGGVIDKKTGDGLLAFFGDSEGLTPKAAAQAAVRAAVQIQTKLENMSEGLLGAREKIHARVGVNSGVMMIGNAGSEHHFNYTVLGEPVNFTARLEAACPAGSVLVGEKTASYVQEEWKMEPMQIRIKHEDLPVTAYRVLGSAKN